MNRLTRLCSFILCCAFPIAAQTRSSFSSFSSSSSSSPGTPGHTQPQVSEVLISPDTVSELHLKPNFATSILMPEPVASVVLGAPGLFKEEHSEHDPDLVTVKPITRHAATSNLLISTRSGQHISLQLISDGGAVASAPVDFVLIYRLPHDFLIPSDDTEDAILSAPPTTSKPLSIFETAFEDQQRVASPPWNAQHDPKQPVKIAASLGSVTADGSSMVVTFSVLNQSSQWIEVLPPQIELNNPAIQPGEKKPNKKRKDILADQVPIADYRYTQRKVAPGARSDGVVRFERPNFKQLQERLQLELATADAVNHPLLLNLPFTAPAEAIEPVASGQQENSNERQ
jgi:hypothetical protein